MTAPAMVGANLGKNPAQPCRLRKNKTLMEAANEKGPCVLVGPSFGGFIVRVFAGQYRTDVAGMILVEASHEDQRERRSHHFS